MNILYCEDEEDIRDVIHSLIEDMFPDSRVTVCKNGVEGIEAIQNSIAFDLVISDNQMPSVEGKRGDGKALFQFFRNSGHSAPFVICSGCHESEFSELLHEKNFYYLPKIKLTLDSKDFFIKILENSSSTTRA